MEDVVATLVCLHALGGSRRAFDALTRELAGEFDILALDLPGFGDAPVELGTSVQEMADHVVRQVPALLGGSREWVLLGHGAGGKVASVVAAQAVAGDLPAPSGVVLLAASPPGPEPLDEARRARMLSWVADGPLDAAASAEFVATAVGGPLELAAAERAVADLLGTTPAAWRDWLERGSREDWSQRVGVLDLPALVVAGGADRDLGEDVQRRLHGPVYPRATFRTLAGAGHLLPLERPREVAAALRASRPART